MRLTIERLRLLVLVAGGLLIVALGVFLARGHWKNRFNLGDIPKRLGANIERQENEVVYTQSSHGHLLFKLRASKVVQLKNNGHALLSNVEIELYGKDGATVDQIRGGQFDWDNQGKTATAAGPVEILIMRPTATPAVAEDVHGAKPVKPKAMAVPLSNAAESVAKGQIEVKTSGLTFDQRTGAATTAQRVEFSTVQGSGNAVGASFDSDNGQLVLDRDVELNIRRGDENVRITAQHAEFDRDQLTCNLRGAAADYRGGEATAGQAQILFRQNGSAVRLDAHGGFLLTTATGARIAAPEGSLDFNEQNQPRQGRMTGGVTMASSSGGQETSGSAPQADLAFSPQGELRHAHLERGVTMHSEQDGPGGIRAARDWRSPVADVAFRSEDGHTEIAQVNGTGGVVVSGVTQRPGAPPAPSRMSADEVTGAFGAGQELSELIGTGHAALEQTTSAGARQTTSGNRIEAHFAPAGGKQASQQIQSAVIDGNVVLTDREPAKPDAKTGETAAVPLRATSAHATYEGAGQWLHLTDNPRIEEGGLELTADKVDVSQASGDAFAHGNVKATWMENGGQVEEGAGEKGGIGLGGEGPSHVIAAEAQMHRATDEATFRGHARLWQGANSVSAPEIVLNRARQTLVAQGNSEPVNLVLVSANGTGRQRKSARSGPSVIRVRAGDLKYSAGERKAVLRSEDGESVVAKSEDATISSREAEITLLPPGNHAGPEGRAAQVDRITALGHVSVLSQGRHGTGEKLVYSSETEEYVLTGTAGTPPRMTDAVHGTVTGSALIFNTRDDSVSVEGQGQKTSTETTAPR